MKTDNYANTMRRFHRLPDWLSLLMVRGLNLFILHADCRVGQHTKGAADANYCAVCGCLLNQAAWRQWTVGLRDGTYRVVSATNEVHARNLVRYGEVRPGQMDSQAALEGRQLVAAENIISCTAGQVVSVL